MAVVPTTYQDYQSNMLNGYNYAPGLYETQASAMGQLNWAQSYPAGTQIGVGQVNSAMGTLFPHFSRGASQKVDIQCKWIVGPNGQHCGRHFNFMGDVVHHITMDHVGGPGKIPQR